jgi:hypothetical protein
MKRLIKAASVIVLSVFLLMPFTAEAIQMQTVGPGAEGWTEVFFDFEFNGYSMTSSYAGEFEIAVGQGEDAFNSVGYCVELDEPIGVFQTYDVKLMDVTSHDQGLQAAWLMNEYAYGLGNIPAGATAEDKLYASAALQLAIWDTIYGDHFTVTTANTESVYNYYNSYIDGLARADVSGDFADDFSIAHIADVQDLLVFNPSAVPEPATSLLMVCGLAFLVVFTKNNSKVGCRQ